jgi:HORMA domain-containing protein
MNTTFASAYARTHTAAFVSDKMRNLLKILIQYYGLDPTKLVDAWSSWVDRAARYYMETEVLQKIVIEFYKPGATVASARWDFPIRYDGNGVDEMWVDREFMQGSFAKATAPPPGCTYRVLLLVAPGTPDLDGLESTSFLDLNGKVAREAGTVIATPDLMASAVYYK